jgi:hypothetical protein
MKWISVKERLPEINEYVLVVDKNNDVSKASYIEGNIFPLGSHYWIPELNIKPIEKFIVWTKDGCCAESMDEVTHWLPLPCGPEEQE